MPAFENLSPVQWVMLAGGIFVVLGGMLVLWGNRLAAGRGEQEGDSTRLARRFLGISESTRLVIGVAALIGGYHLAIWALPPDSTPVQVPRHLWWVVAGGIALVVGGSIVLDRVERSGGQGST